MKSKGSFVQTCGRHECFMMQVSDAVNELNVGIKANMIISFSEMAFKGSA